MIVPTIARLRLLIAAAAVVATGLAGGCFAPAYLAQAGYGQLELMTNARPIGEVIADPNTDDRTRLLLQEVPGIKRYAAEIGLEIDGNYRHFIQLDRSASVWFIAASKPLAFEPKVWCWPIVGCFPMLGWFDLEQATEFRGSLINDGWEVVLRGAGAFSTAGWFRDPVVSSMLRPDENAYGGLVNVILHELMHVTVLVEDQAYFNESIAAFTGDGMAEDYLRRRFGEGSPVFALYLEQLAEERVMGERLWRAYKELDALYQSTVSDREKLGKKKAIIDGLMNELPFRRRPNNASLIGFKTYNTGFAEFAQLREVCRSWPAFMRAVKSIRGKHFKSELQEDFAPVIKPLIERRCKPY